MFDTGRIQRKYLTNSPAPHFESLVDLHWGHALYGFCQPLTVNGKDTRAGTALLTASFGLKALQWPYRTFLRLHGSLGHCCPVCLCVSFSVWPRLLLLRDQWIDFLTCVSWFSIVFVLNCVWGRTLSSCWCFRLLSVLIWCHLYLNF